MSTHCKHMIFGLGNPLLSIYSKVEQSFLEKYKLETNNAIIADIRHAGIYKDLIDHFPVSYIAGGSGQNTLRGAQHLLPPNTTFYTGCVGDDIEAEYQRQAAIKDGLTVDYIVNVNVSTGICATLINGQHRSMVADLRAAQYYQPSYLERPNVQTAINHAHCFYIEGFFLTVSLDSILTLAKHAATNNKIFAMNISAPFLCQFFCEAMDATTPYWDFIFGNETEAIAWATCHGYETKKLQEIALLLANQPKLNNRRKRYVIITQGSQATLVAKQGQISVEQVQSFTVKSIPQEEIKDTEGAGDAFVGGFLSQYLQGKSIAYSVQVGHLLAGCIIRQMGAQYPSTLNLSELHV